MQVISRFRLTFGAMALTVVCLYLATFGQSTGLAQVSTGTIRVAPGGNDVVGCGSVVSPCKTIQFAVNQVVQGSSATILVAAGTYTYNAMTDICSGSIGLTGVVCVLNKTITLLGGYTSGNWSTADPTVNVTLIDGQNTRRGVLVQRTAANAPATTLIMEGFTIENGLAQGANSGNDTQISAFGGGMLADASIIKLKNTIFRNNRSIGGSTGSAYGGASGGGGLALRAASAGTTLEQLIFDNNEARGGNGASRGGFGIGGGLFTFQAIAVASSITFTNNSAIAGDSAGSGSAGGEFADGQGGGAAIQLGSVVTLQNVTATNNTARGGNAGTNAGGAFGGGIFGELATLQISDSYIGQNLAQGGNGFNGGLGAGGGMSSTGTNLTIERTQIIDNISTGGNGSNNTGAAGGGGAYLINTSTTSIINSIIADNLTEMGSTGAAIGGGGGGLFLQNITGVNIIHTTLANNVLGRAPMQGQAIALLNSTTANISFSIIADHTNGFGAAALHVQPGNTVNLNRGLWVGNTKNDNSDNSPAPGGTFNGLGTMLSAGSAGFISPGSPNFNYHLSNSSAAKDQATGSTTSVDVDNEPRAYGIGDIGADENAPIVLSVLVGDALLRLNWVANPDLVSGVDHYHILYSFQAGATPANEGPSPINAGIQTNFTLTGLTNGKLYTITIEARNAANNVLATSNTVTAFPTNNFSYLPFLRK